MRLALAADGTRGDVHPMLALGERFAAHGHDVVFCASPDARPDVEARGFEFRPIGIDVRSYLSRHADALAGGAWPMLRASYRYFHESSARQFPMLADATRDVDCLFGAGVLFAGPSAAERNGIPYRYVVFCPGLFPSADHPPCLFPIASLSRLATRLTWALFLKLFLPLLARPIDRWRAELGLPPVRPLYRHLISDRPILAADAALAPLPADCPIEVEQIPCLHPSAPGALPEKLAAFLEEGPPPVYFGFGSMTDPDPAETTRMILAAVDRLGCRALLSRGWAGLGDVALPGHVQVVESVSHTALFPRCAAIVHHGGAGTTTTAARSGTPQVVVPHAVDQFYWANRVALLGIGGPAVARTRLRPQSVVDSLSIVLENETIAERARDIGERLLADLALDDGSVPAI